VRSNGARPLRLVVPRERAVKRQKPVIRRGGSSSGRRGEDQVRRRPQEPERLADGCELAAQAVRQVTFGRAPRRAAPRARSSCTLPARVRAADPWPVGWRGRRPHVGRVLPPRRQERLVKAMKSISLRRSRGDAEAVAVDGCGSSPRSPMASRRRDGEPRVSSQPGEVRAVRVLAVEGVALHSPAIRDGKALRRRRSRPRAPPGGDALPASPPSAQRHNQPHSRDDHAPRMHR